ncbi:PDZ domain-containing protein MAGIX [Talpa occidentalis]|uniref:PDZ domain-containing protein MAGIX n=1 Tax=Talpa occidentalis TaxID=50954 RepID=UPI00188EB65F|nr:PDZ domain-containing protein MAGIX [Talpa occidentalis]
MERRAGVAADPSGRRGGGKQSSPGAQAAAAAAAAEGRGQATQLATQRPEPGSRPPTCTRSRRRSPAPAPAARAAHHTRSAGRGLSLPAGRSARQLLERLDARPLAARAANDVAALVRRAGATLRLRPKEATCMLDSAEIEVTDSRLPNPTLVEHPPQHRHSNTLGTRATQPQMTQAKLRCASKHPQGSGQFCVELVRGPLGFGLTLSGGRDATGNTPLAVGGLLKDGPAQRCGRLQAGDLVLRINGESTQDLSHAQVLERIRAGSPRLHLVLRRPLENHPGKPEGVSGPQKGDDRPGPGRPEVLSSSCASASPFLHPGSCEPRQTRGNQEPSPERAANDSADSPAERHTEDPGDPTPGSPGPWLVPSEERLSRALGIPGYAQLSLEMAAGRRRH